MSVRAVQWALEVRVGDPTAKLVLLALADEADGDGLCWPFMRRLAARAEVSEKTVSRKIAFLDEAGLLEKKRKRRRSGRLSGYHYALALTPEDNLSGGDGAADEDAPSAPEPAAPLPHGQDEGRVATGASDGPSPAPSDPEHTPAPATPDDDPPPPPDRLSGGPADNVSGGPPDTAVSPGPADTQVSAGKDLDPPCTDPPPPPTPSTGGGGSADALDLTPTLVALADRLDPVRRRRLLTEPVVQRAGLDITLAARLDDGWSIEDLADQLTDGSLAEVGSLAGVLRSRAQRLAGVDPPRARRRDAVGMVPTDVLDELERRAADDAVLADGSVDPELRRRRLDELAGAWLAEHQAQEVGAR